MPGLDSLGFAWRYINEPFLAGPLSFGPDIGGNSAAFHHLTTFADSVLIRTGAKEPNTGPAKPYSTIRE